MLPSPVTESDGSVTELGQAGAMLMAELLDAHAARTVADERIEKARAAIEILMGDASEALVNGAPVITRKTVVSRRFDAQTAKRFLTPEQIEASTVEVVTRPFKRVAQ